MNNRTKYERDDFIMKLINLLIRNSIIAVLGMISESCAMPKFVSLIAFLYKLISEEHVVVIMEFPDWVQVKMKILYLPEKNLFILMVFQTIRGSCFIHGFLGGATEWVSRKSAIN